MYYNYPMMSYGSSFGPMIGLLALWSIFWKVVSGWKAARSNQKLWFVALLILNTAGILDLLYLFVFSKPTGLPMDLFPKNAAPSTKSETPKQPEHKA